MPPGGAPGERECSLVLECACGCGRCRRRVDPDGFPEQPKLTYVTETASGSPKVWIAAANGAARSCSDRVSSRCWHRMGSRWRWRCSAPRTDRRNTDRRSGYTRPRRRDRRLPEPRSRTATPLAWSPDSRYLAVYASRTGPPASRRVEPGRDRHADRTVATIAQGAIYGASFAREGSDRLVYALAHSLSPSAKTNLYVAEADGAGAAADHQRRSQPVARLGAALHRLRP